MMLLAFLLALASVEAEGAEAARAESSVVLESKSGELRRLPLDELDTEDPREIGAVIVRFEGKAEVEPSAPGSAWAEVVLGRGDRLRGSIESGAQGALRVHLLGDVQVDIAIDALKSVIFVDRLTQDFDPRPAAEGDRLYRLTGDSIDVIDGTVDAFVPEGVRFAHSQLGDKLYPWSEVAALFVESLEEDSGEPCKDLVPVACDLLDGSRLSGGLVRLGESGAELCIAGGARIALPASILAEVVVDDGSIAFLSELVAQATAEGSPFGDDLGMRWPHRIDRSVTGLPLQAKGRTFQRGIGVHAPSRLLFELDGSWASLRGFVAIDDQVLALGVHGSAIFRILVDGEERWQSGIVRADQEPIALPVVDLSGARLLELVVDMAQDLHVGDRADWLRILLVRRG